MAGLSPSILWRTWQPISGSGTQYTSQISKCSIFLALVATTATTIKALPLQQNKDGSTPLGKRFYYTRYVQDDGMNSASDPPPFGYDQYQGSQAKRFYYTRYIANDD